MSIQKQKIYKVKISRLVNVMASSGYEAMQHLIKLKDIKTSEYVDEIQNIIKVKKNGKKRIS